MQSTESKSHGTQPPPQASSKTGHPLPRRTSPANSITLKHHRLAHEASLRADRGSSSIAPKPQQPPSAAVKPSLTVSSPRRNSSGDSHDTSRSDPRKWFDQSNQNPTATFDNTVMDIDPPFFQKETDSSNEEKIYSYDHLAPSKPTRAHSSSADDYRSVIDDLTIEIHRLKEELKRYKQLGPDMLRKDKLFEIKVHGLPSRKKRELEATLRDFASNLDGSNGTSSSNNKKKHESHHAKRDRMYSGSGSMSKHASSSSGSRPADSAYASMSTGANSSGTSLGRQSMNTQGRSSEQKVQSYLRDIPEGLYPRHMAMTDKERKKLVVRRLEQLFTGKIGGRHAQRKQSNPVPTTTNLAPVVSDMITQSGTAVHQPPSLLQHEPSREAKILPREQQSIASGVKSRSRDNASASNSNEDQTESSGNGTGSGSGTNPSPKMASLPEQRPTRPKDLDPDRVQIPSENMDYIRHLGLIPPELLEQRHTFQDVHPDADGWVYLNLLCNMAQLHMINVTPDFIRSAVSEISTKFQLSPDGRKIRWRGGTEGTRFSSDSSGYNSQKSPSTDDTDGSTRGGRKRKKTGRSTDEKPQSGSSSKNASKSGPQVSTSSESFHYKPLFAHQDSTSGQTSLEDTVSFFGPAEDSNFDDSKYGVSGSGSTARRKRRRDGAIIYYNGAPFCTDLSGDPGDVSPTAHMAAGVQQSERRFAQPPLQRSESGSLISYKPLSARGHLVQSSSRMNVDSVDSRHEHTNDDDDVSEIDLDLCWSSTPQFLNFRTLEPCGIGGVLPEDHFMVVVATKRPRQDARLRAKSFDERATSPEGTDAVIRRLATMSTSSPVLAAAKPALYNEPSLEIEYTSGRIKRLTPVSLPPPAIFFPPFSTDESASTDWMSGSDDEMDIESSSFLAQHLQPRRSHDYPDNVDLSSGDEEGEEPDDSPQGPHMCDVDGHGQVSILERRRQSEQSSSAAAAAGTMRSKSTSADPMIRTDRSSVATAGGAESGYNSGGEEMEEESSDSS